MELEDGNVDLLIVGAEESLTKIAWVCVFVCRERHRKSNDRLHSAEEMMMTAYFQ